MAGEPAGLELRVLGPVEAWREGAAVALGGKRQRALLGLLLIARGNPVSSDLLVDELWRGQPPPGAAGTLQSYVSRLRAALGDAAEIVGAAASYRIAIAPEHVDAWRFEALVEEGGAAAIRGAHERASERFESALELWRGSPFGDVADDGSLRDEGARFEEIRLRAIDGRIAARLEGGSAAELVAELEALVAEHPFRETLWRHLMLALYRSGRQKDALDAYTRARTLLSDELGLEPGAELKDLQRAILREEVPQARSMTRRREIPTPASPFFGRARELAELAELLQDSRLVTLTGVGGVGKTRLAIETAHHAWSDFHEAVFVDLASVTQSQAVARRIAAALDVREQTDVALERHIAARIGTDRLLLILDNCEHLRDACRAVVSALLPTCPGLHLLTTSRESLGCDGETEYSVPPLESLAAVDLFFARARAVRPRLADDDAARETAAAICSDLDGLPLAIELAAARARALSLDEIASRLADRFAFLVSWRRLTTARHRTLERAMDWSYELLDEPEQRLLARLSVFSGGFTLAAAASVGLEATEDGALTAVERLVDASLVVAEERDGPTRYRLLETVRQYSAARLDDRGETEVLRRRQAEYVAQLLAARQEESQGDIGRWVDAVRADYDNVMTALVWSRQAGSAEEQLRLAGLAWRLWWVRGTFVEGREWLDGALARDPRADPRLRALALEGAAGLAWASGDFDGMAVAHEARALFVQAGDERGELGTNTILGHLALSTGQYADARPLFERTRELAQRAIDAGSTRAPADLALAVLNLATTAQLMGDVDGGELFYLEARDRYADLDNRWGVALAQHLTANLAVDAGRYDDAAGCVREALPVFNEMAFAQYTWQAIETAAAIAHFRGAPTEAARLLAAAAQLRQRSGISPAPWEQLPVREREALARELGDQAFAAAWEDGRALTRDEAAAHALKLLAE
jgi:predicted ATPase